MSLFALIHADRVAHTAAAEFPVHKDMVWVDVTNTTPGPQVGWSARPSGASWMFEPPAAPVPTLAQQAGALLASGLSITSTSDPELSGVYACNAAAQSRLATIMLYVHLHGTFPGGALTYPWPDRAGAIHTMPSTAAFTAVYTAISDHVAALADITLTGMGTLPAASVTIP